MYLKEQTKINANWIWHENDCNPVNQYIIFRKKISVCKPIEKASMIITADARYWAYIGGEFISRGPAKGFSHEYFYDEIDITYDLGVGDNQFVFIASHIGVNIHQHILGQPGFLCQINIYYSDGTKQEIASDDSFLVSLHAGVSEDSFRISCGQGYAEIYDASDISDKIFEDDFDDSEWAKAKIRYSYENSYWGNLQIRQTPPLTCDPVYPKAVLSDYSVLSDGVSVVMDFNHKFIKVEDLQISAFNRPQWFYTFFNIESPAEMEIDMIFCYSRLWCAYGKFSINGRVYLEEFDSFMLDPRQGGPVNVRVRLDKGTNYVVMNCSNDSMGKHYPIYFDTKGAKLEFSSPINPEMGAAFTASHLAELDTPQKEEMWSQVWSWLIEKRFEMLPGLIDEIETKYVSFNSPQIRSIYRKVVGSNDINCIKPALHSNRNMARLLPDGFDREITLDFGEEVAGMIEFTVAATRGTTFDFYGVEYIDMEGKRQEMDGVCNGLRYFAREGKQTYRSFVPRGFRYLICSVRNFSCPVIFSEIKVLQSTHPVANTGDFICNDYKLNKIWEISRRTAALCMFDTSVDCPGHEQSFWIGDFRNEALVGHFLFGAYEHVDHCLKVPMGSLKRNPLPEASVPSIPQGVMPTWSLLFMMAYYELYLYSGDKEILARHYDRFIVLIENCISMIDQNGLFKTPYNDMVDWAPVDLRPNAYNTHSNAFLYRNLIYISMCAGELGKNEDATKYALKAKLLKASINSKLWSESKNAFFDCMTTEWVPSEHYSIQVQSVLVMTGCADMEKAAVLEYYFKSGFPKDFQKIGSPFASMFYHEALSRLGLVTRILDDIRKGWGLMVDVGSTTCFETFPGWEKEDLTRSYCHAWSSSPCYVAGHDILGVVPLEPGFRKTLVAPRLGDLQWARGRVAIPGGYISVEAKINDGKTHAKVIAPKDITIEKDPSIEYEVEFQ